jgi:hypothetical protein
LFPFAVLPRRKGRVSGFEFEVKGEEVTFPTSNVRFVDGFAGFFAECLHLNAPHEGGSEWTPHSGAQFHVFAGICHADLGDRAGGAQVGRPCLPGGFEQTAFFEAAPAKVVAVEVGAFFAGGGFHGKKNYSPFDKTMSGRLV